MKPPHNTEAEENLLGAMLVAPSAILAAQDAGLTPDALYRPSHQRICTAIYALDAQGEQADTITVSRFLEETGDLEGAGGRAVVNTLASEVASVSNASAYARIVVDVAAERAIQTAATKLAGLAGASGSAADKMALAEQIVGEATGAIAGEDFEQIGQAAGRAYARIEEAVVTGKRREGLKTGFTKLDELTNGFEPGQLIILAARPGFGKSTLAQNVTEHVAKRGKHVAIFSLEMAAEEIGKRMLSSLSGVGHEQIRQAAMTQEQLGRVREAAQTLNDLPIYTIDGSTNLTELRARTRRLKRSEGLDLLVVDYLQLVDPGRGHESQQVKIAEISRAMKLLAMELGIPVLALSQLSRGLEARENKRPRLADLRDSGAIEQDADVVLFIYRDDYYDIESDRAGEAEVIVAKQRSGPLGFSHLVFQAARCRFSNPGGQPVAVQEDAVTAMVDDIPF